MNLHFKKKKKKVIHKKFHKIFHNNRVGKLLLILIVRTRFAAQAQMTYQKQHCALTMAIMSSLSCHLDSLMLHPLSKH